MKKKQMTLTLKFNERVKTGKDIAWALGKVGEVLSSWDRTGEFEQGLTCSIYDKEGNRVGEAAFK